MFVRIAGIELKRPLLQWIVEPDAGLQVRCETPEGVYDESGAKKLLAMKGSPHLPVKWKNKAGEDHARTMCLCCAKAWSESPDGKKITKYHFTLVDSRQ